MSEEKAVVKKKIGTPKTESIIGSAAVKMNQASKNLADALKGVAQIETILNNGAVEVAALEDNIAALKQKYANEKAQLDIQLQLDFKASKDELISNFLRENGLVKLKAAEFSELTSEFNKLKTDFKQNVASEVAVAVNSAKKDLDAQKAQLEANFRVEQAETKAKISELEARLNMALETSKMLETQLNAERSASTERAKSSAVGTINVGQTK